MESLIKSEIPQEKNFQRKKIRIKITPEPIDTIYCDTAVISYFQDERPLKRWAGLIDWRSNGYLSKLLINNKIQGNFAETLLYKLHKIKPNKILMVGLGKSGNYELEKFQDIISYIIKVLFKLKSYDFVISLPVVGLKGVTHSEVIELFIVELNNHTISIFDDNPSEITSIILCEREIIGQIKNDLRSIIEKYKIPAIIEEY